MKNLLSSCFYSSNIYVGAIKPLFCGCWTIIIVALALCSVYMIKIGLGDDRAYNLSEYKDSISEWNSVYRDEFSDLQISPHVNYNETDVRHILLKQSTDPESLSEDVHGELEEYEAVFYEEFYQDVSILDLSNSMPFDLDMNLTISLLVTSSQDDNERSLLGVKPIPMFRVQRKSGRFPSGCDSEHGYYEAKSLECLTYWVSFS